MREKEPRRLGEDEAEAYVGGICFKTGPPGRTGVELEWLVHDARDPAALIPAERLDAALAPLEARGRPRSKPPPRTAPAPGTAPPPQPPSSPPGLLRGGRLTREPGGQVELSSLPADSLTDCLAATAADLAVLREALARAGLTLHGRGLDPRRSPSRVLEHPRYRAMERYFDRSGPWGRMMMRATASVQVSLDAGEDGDGILGYRRRWLLAHRLGPVLVAAFANSALWRGRPTGWLSTRQAIWSRMDPGRTRPPRAAGGDPRADWARYALDAHLMCLRRSAPDSWTAPPGMAFRSWLRGAPEAGRQPTVGDLEYHLGTLFPPVRPRGWLELRMIDAQPGDGWTVATAVAATLLDDPVAAETAFEATAALCAPARPAPPAGSAVRGGATDREPLERAAGERGTGGSLADRRAGRPAGCGSPAAPVGLGPAPRPNPALRARRVTRTGSAVRGDVGVPGPEVWLRAARHGPADPSLAPVVRHCFDAVREALARRGESPALRAAVEDFVQRYVDRGRCPAHDQLDAWRAGDAERCDQAPAPPRGQPFDPTEGAR